MGYKIIMTGEPMDNMHIRKKNSASTYCFYLNAAELSISEIAKWLLHFALSYVQLFTQCYKGRTLQEGTPQSIHYKLRITTMQHYHESTPCAACKYKWDTNEDTSSSCT